MTRIMRILIFDPCYPRYLRLKNYMHEQEYATVSAFLYI